MSRVTTSTPLPDTPALDACTHAARLVQWTGLLETAFFGLATAAVFRAYGASPEELHRLTGAALSLEQWRALHPQLGVVASLLALSGLLPGVVLLCCSVGIRRGSGMAAILAVVIAGMQLFALAGILVRQVIVAFAVGEPSAMTVNVLVLGTPMTLLVLVIRTLFATRRETKPV